MKKSELIDFLDEYSEEDYDVRVTDQIGFKFELAEADWANGPWLVIEYDEDELLGVLGAERVPDAETTESEGRHDGE